MKIRLSTSAEPRSPWPLILLVVCIVVGGFVGAIMGKDGSRVLGLMMGVVVGAGFSELVAHFIRSGIVASRTLE